MIKLDSEHEPTKLLTIANCDIILINNGGCEMEDHGAYVSYCEIVDLARKFSS